MEQARSSIQKQCSGILNHNCFGQTPKYNSNVLFLFKKIHSDLYYYVRYSNIEYQDEIFFKFIESVAQNIVDRFGFEHRFHDLNHFEVGHVH